ncbi:MAG: hydrogenase maturation protease [Anaeromyxobacteraceae bacterium]
MVFALGNPLRGDDGAGPAAVSGLDLGAAQVVVAHQLLPEHADLLAGATLAVFVDAREGGAAGALLDEEVVPGGDAPLSHHFAPGHLLALARALHGRAPRALALSVSGADFGHGERLSREVNGALLALRERLRGVVGVV